MQKYCFPYLALQGAQTWFSLRNKNNKSYAKFKIIKSTRVAFLVDKYPYFPFHTEHVDQLFNFPQTLTLNCSVCLDSYLYLLSRGSEHSSFVSCGSWQALKRVRNVLDGH